MDVTFHLRSGAQLTVQSSTLPASRSPLDGSLAEWSISYPAGYTGRKIHTLSPAEIEAITFVDLPATDGPPDFDG